MPLLPWIWTWKIKIAPAEARLDRAILAALAEGLGDWSPPADAGEDEGEGPPVVTRARLGRWFDEGRVTRDGTQAKGSAPVQMGQLIRVEIPAPVPLAAVAEEGPLDILHEDRDLIVLNKPQGLPVHPSETRPRGTLVNRLLHQVKDLSGIGGELRPGIVHRLDADTSGVLVVTKTDTAHLTLAEVFRRHEIERVYWALCYGKPREGRIETRIGRNPSNRKQMAVLPSGGRNAITHLKVLRDFGFASLVECRLETGRTHQIRVHLAHLGHSVIGDPVYGVPSARAAKWLALPESARTFALALPGQALHARVLGFKHPTSGRQMRFEVEPPEAFRGLLASLSGVSP